MTPDDFFRTRLLSMIDVRPPLVVLTIRRAWSTVQFTHQGCLAKAEKIDGLFGAGMAEFGVKGGLATVTHKGGLKVGACSFSRNPYDGQTLAEQLEQARNLCQGMGVQSKIVAVEQGCCGVGAENPAVKIIHRGKLKSLTALHRCWVKQRRQAMQPVIEHAKAAHRMGPCWLLQGALGDALNPLSCALGDNIRWRMRALLTPACKVLSCLLQMGAAHGRQHFAALRERLLLELLSSGSLQAAQPFTGPGARVLAA